MAPTSSRYKRSFNSTIPSDTGTTRDELNTGINDELGTNHGVVGVLGPVERRVASESNVLSNHWTAPGDMLNYDGTENFL